MKILIDGDACCVIDTTERIASEFSIECHIYCDDSRILESDYSEIHIVDKSPDSADFAIANNCERGDIVITNDSGLAAMILAKGGFVLNSRGTEYNNKNIMSFLTRRFIRKDARKKTKRDQLHGYTMCKNSNAKNQHKPFKVVLKNIICRTNKMEMKIINYE